MFDKFYGNFYTGFPFKLFGYIHLITIGIILFFCILTYLLKEKLKQKRINKIVRYTLAAIMSLLFVLVWYCDKYNNVWTIKNSFPLQLCDVTAILTVIMLIKPNKTLYEICYFSGIGGAMEAILTPNIGDFWFPHFRFFQFFICHGIIIISVLLLTFTLEFRPTLKSIIKNIVFLNIYAIIIEAVNFLIGANYLFLRQKPSQPSVIDYLGPWPAYILSLEAFAVVTFFIFYIPFIIKDRANKNNYKNNTQNNITM